MHDLFTRGIGTDGQLRPPREQAPELYQQTPIGWIPKEWQEEIKPCIHPNHVFRVRPRDGQLRSYFLAFWSQSEMGKKYFVLNSKQSTNLASINSTQLNRFPVALPSSIEQERIEARIAAQNGYADSLRQELAKLQQQKSGLMHDLLTGKITVTPIAEKSEALA